jgi:hypothetical protein
MTTDQSPKRWRKRWKLLVFGGILTLLALYLIIIGFFFQTPKASHWIDDETYWNTRYFHFAAGKDGWSESLPIEPPQSAGSAYRLAIVELDEFGDFFQSERDPARPEDYQLACAKEMLLKAGSVDGKPVLLFLFIHGWRHDASREDENLIAFKRLLGHLARSQWASNFSLCGVYVGWRGASVKHCGWFTVPAEYYSFWKRKSVAENIAGTSSSTALFGLVDTARKAAPNPTGNPSRIVLAGHSLGAGILMNSVSQALAYEYARASSGHTDPNTPVILDSPANLILLLNPAVESVYLRQLRESMQPVNWNGYPWLVSLTSETDSVTKRLFPLAHTFTSDARRPPYFEVDWRDYKAPGSPDPAPTNASPRQAGPVSQKVYATETPGHNAYMRDLHVVVRKSSTQDVATLRKNVANPDDVIAYNMAYGGQKYFLLRGEEGWPWYGYFDNVRPKSEIHPLFWVATVDRMIMDGHGLPFDDDVRRDNFVGTVMALVADSRVQFTQAASKVQVRAIKPRLPARPALKERK